MNFLEPNNPFEKNNNLFNLGKPCLIDKALSSCLTELDGDFKKIDLDLK